ncbi:MAG: hypothetical protein JWL70_1454, partial [Acidimicrobiia bacterium]|nr:hypothetical protein [Acidimicrobiia bacterium]
PQLRAEAAAPTDPFMMAVTGYTQDATVLRQLQDAGVDALFLTVGRLVKETPQRRRDAIREYADRIFSALK